MGTHWPLLALAIKCPPRSRLLALAMKWPLRSRFPGRARKSAVLLLALQEEQDEINFKYFIALKRKMYVENIPRHEMVPNSSFPRPGQEILHRGPLPGTGEELGHVSSLAGPGHEVVSYSSLPGTGQELPHPSLSRTREEVGHPRGSGVRKTLLRLLD